LVRARARAADIQVAVRQDAMMMRYAMLLLRVIDGALGVDYGDAMLLRALAILI